MQKKVEGNLLSEWEVYTDKIENITLSSAIFVFIN